MTNEQFEQFTHLHYDAIQRWFNDIVADAMTHPDWNDFLSLEDIEVDEDQYFELLNKLCSMWFTVAWGYQNED